MPENKTARRDGLYIATIAILVCASWMSSYKAHDDSGHPKEAVPPTSTALPAQVPVEQADGSASLIQQHAQISPQFSDEAEKRLQATTDPDVPAEETNRFASESGSSDQSSSSQSNFETPNSQGESAPDTQELPPQSAPVYQPSPARIPKVPRVTLSSGGIYIGAGSGHWISENHDGEIIELEDGSMWQVDAVDTVEAAIWLPVSNITVIDSTTGVGYELINTDDHEKVSATLIKQ
jgi:hypothetical protein